MKWLENQYFARYAKAHADPLTPCAVFAPMLFSSGLGRPLPAYGLGLLMRVTMQSAQDLS